MSRERVCNFRRHRDEGSDWRLVETAETPPGPWRCGICHPPPAHLVDLGDVELRHEVTA